MIIYFFPIYLCTYLLDIHIHINNIYLIIKVPNEYIYIYLYSIYLYSIPAYILII